MEGIKWYNMTRIVYFSFLQWTLKWPVAGVSPLRVSQFIIPFRSDEG